MAPTPPPFSSSTISIASSAKSSGSPSKRTFITAKQIPGYNAPVRYRAKVFKNRPSDSDANLSRDAMSQHQMDPRYLSTVGFPKFTGSDEDKFSKIANKFKEQENLLKQTDYRLVNFLEKNSHFDANQVRALLEIYRKLRSTGKLNRLSFRDVLHNTFELTDNTMLDQVFHVFDGDNQGSVSESEWILGLSVMLHGKLEEQIAFAYEVYDIDGDRRIGRKEITQCLGSCLHSAYMDDDELTAEEGTRELVDIVLRKMDKDRDGALKFRDFYKSIQTDPLLLQALGPCLPSEKAMMTFLTLIDTNCRNYKSYLSHPHDPSWIRERNKFAPPGSDRFLPKPLEPRRSKRLSSDPKLKSVFRYKNQSNSGDKDKRSEATS